MPFVRYLNRRGFLVQSALWTNLAQPNHCLELTHGDTIRAVLTIVRVLLGRGYVAGQTASEPATYRLILYVGYVATRPGANTCTSGPALASPRGSASVSVCVRICSQDTQMAVIMFG